MSEQALAFWATIGVLFTILTVGFGLVYLGWMLRDTH